MSCTPLMSSVSWTNEIIHILGVMQRSQQTYQQTFAAAVN